jgi:hypothetical protein
MNRLNHYETVSQAISELQKKGYTIDFNLKENSLVYHYEKYGDCFKIVDVYRYEGNSDPADEAVVYAIESNTGLKGILVAGFGISVDTATTEILAKLTMKKM